MFVTPPTVRKRAPQISFNATSRRPRSFYERPLSVALPAHKISAVRAAVEATGARLLFLPPYSPEFNPIETVFSKLKALLRKAAARAVDHLWAAIASAIGTFTSAECANFFAAAGHDAD